MAVSEIVAIGECRRCHERRTLVAHGALCEPCLTEVTDHPEES